MLFDDSYQTLAQPVEGLFKDRGGKFLGFGFGVNNEQDVKNHLQALRELHPKANHHCYAYRFGLDRTQFRANDDGEPAGSAGKPILNVLYAQNLTNVLVVVVRYFGGTLLGVPGLINAYKQTTLETLTNAPTVTRYVCDLYELRFSYLLMNNVMKILKAHNLPIKSQTFDNDCVMEIEIRQSLLNQVLPKLNDVEGLHIDYKMTL